MRNGTNHSFLQRNFLLNNAHNGANTVFYMVSTTHTQLMPPDIFRTQRQLYVSEISLE